MKWNWHLHVHQASWSTYQDQATDCLNETFSRLLSPLLDESSLSCIPSQKLQLQEHKKQVEGRSSWLNLWGYNRKRYLDHQVDTNQDCFHHLSKVPGYRFFAASKCLQRSQPCRKHLWSWCLPLEVRRRHWTKPKHPNFQGIGPGLSHVDLQFSFKSGPSCSLVIWCI